MKFEDRWLLALEWANERFEHLGVNAVKARKKYPGFCVCSECEWMAMKGLTGSGREAFKEWLEVHNVSF